MHDGVVWNLGRTNIYLLPLVLSEDRQQPAFSALSPVRALIYDQEQISYMGSSHACSTYTSCTCEAGAAACTHTKKRVRP